MSNKPSRVKRWNRIAIVAILAATMCVQLPAVGQTPPSPSAPPAALDTGQALPTAPTTQRADPKPEDALAKSTVRLYYIEHANLQDVAKSLEVIIQAPAKFQTLTEENAVIVNADEQTQVEIDALIRHLDQRKPKLGHPSSGSMTGLPEFQGQSANDSSESGIMHGDSMSMMPADAATTRKQQVDAVLKKVADAKDDSQKRSARTELRNLLETIFTDDMQSRNQQLQQIEDRARKLRQQYRAREDVKDQIIDLQMKVLEQDAEGLGFPEISQQSPSRSPITMDGPAGLPASEGSPYEAAAPVGQSRDPLVTGPGPGSLAPTGSLTIVDRKFGVHDEIVRDYYLLRDRFEQATTPQKESEAKRLLAAKMKLLEVDLRKSEVGHEAARRHLETTQRLFEKGVIPQTQLDQAKKDVQETELEVERAKALIELYNAMPQSNVTPMDGSNPFGPISGEAVADPFAPIPSEGFANSFSTNQQSARPANRDRPLDELKRSQPAVIADLKKRGHFLESTDGKLYAYVNANFPNGPSMLVVVESATGRRLLDQGYGDVIGKLQFNDDGLATQEDNGYRELRIPQRVLDEKSSKTEPADSAGIPQSQLQSRETPKQEPNSRQSVLEGGWTIVNAWKTENGRAEQLDEHQVRKLGGSEDFIFDGKVLRKFVRRVDQTGPHVTVANEPWGHIVVDESKTPMQIDIVNPNVSNKPVAAGIFKIDGEALTLSLGFLSNPNDPKGLIRPTDFGPGENVLYFECRRWPMPAIAISSQNSERDEAGLPDEEPIPESDFDQMQGEWEMLRETVIGSATPPWIPDPQEVFEHGGSITLTLDQTTLRQSNRFPTDPGNGTLDPTAPMRSSQTLTWGEIQLEPSASPKRIDITKTGDPAATLSGAYEFDGDILRVAVRVVSEEASQTYLPPKAVLPGKDIFYFECRRISQVADPLAAPEALPPVRN